MQSCSGSKSGGVFPNQDEVGVFFWRDGHVVGDVRRQLWSDRDVGRERNGRGGCWPGNFAGLSRAAR